MRIKFGGEIHWNKSKTWFGFHTTWVSSYTKTEWEYTLEKPKKQNWWYLPICYKGIVKQVSF